MATVRDFCWYADHRPTLPLKVRRSRHGPGASRVGAARAGPARHSSTASPLRQGVPRPGYRAFSPTGSARVRLTRAPSLALSGASCNCVTRLAAGPCRAGYCPVVGIGSSGHVL
jgi:hypothetical protein